MIPSFLLIGGQRSGTTSLYRNLCKHPNVLPATRKEVHYFDHHFQKPPSWYWEHFPKEAPYNFITGEASPSYLLNPLAAARAKSLVPEVKLIAILRNPVDRAFSHYRHSVRHKHEKLSFEQALLAEEGRIQGELEDIVRGKIQRSESLQFFSYAHRGRYASHLRIWLEHFPRSRILIVISEEFFAKPTETLQEVARFLELPDWPNLAETMVERFNFGGQHPGVADKTRCRLMKWFEDEIQDLEKLLGRKVPWSTEKGR